MNKALETLEFSEILDDIVDFTQKTKFTTYTSQNSPVLNVSVKLNSFFVKRLKDLDDFKEAELVKEFNVLNLKNFVEEAETCLLSNHFTTLSNVFLVVKVVTLFSSKYSSFNIKFLKKLKDYIKELIKTSQHDIIKISCIAICYILIDFISYSHRKDSFSIIFDEIVLACSNTYKINPFLSLLLLIINCYQSLTNQKFCDNSIFLENTTRLFNNHCEILKNINEVINLELKKARFFHENKGDLSVERISGILNLYAEGKRLEKILGRFSRLLNLEAPYIYIDNLVYIDGTHIVFKNFENSTLSQFSSGQEKVFYSPLTVETKDLGALVAPDYLESNVLDEDPENSNIENEPLFFSIENCLNLSDLDLFSKSLSENPKLSPASISDSFISLTKKRPDLIKSCCRAVAILSITHDDIATKLTNRLEGEFRFLSSLESAPIWSRYRAAYSLGELCKFRLISEGKIFSYIKKCLDSINTSNIIMVCILIETCGMFLYGSEFSHKRIINVVNILNRLKETVFHQAHIVAAINSAVNSIRPSFNVCFNEPLNDQLLYMRSHFRSKNILIESDLKRLLKSLVGYDWNEQKCFSDLIHVLSKAWKMRFSNYPVVAAVIFKLSFYEPSKMLVFVDLVINLFYNLIELPFIKNLNQKRASLLNFISELYKVMLIDEETLIEIYDCILDTFLKYQTNRKVFFPHFLIILNLSLKSTIFFIKNNTWLKYLNEMIFRILKNEDIDKETHFCLTDLLNVIFPLF